MRMLFLRRLHVLFKINNQKKLIRRLTLRFMTSSFTMPKEFSIPFPGGQIAAKSWGNEGGIPVLAMHGWQDNLGTFDRIVPLLSKDLYIVAFDFLGHGLSSHKPLGTFYNYFDMLFEIQRVVDYLKWKHFNIMAHSLGGTLALIYASLFPKNINSLICLDIIKPSSRSPEKLPMLTKDTMQAMLRMEAKLSNPTPVYSLDKAKARLINGSVDEITKEGADALLRRGTKPSESGDGIVFTRDIRIQALEGFCMFSHEDLKAYLNNLKCHLLIIAGGDSKIALSRTPEVIPDILAIYDKNCESFELVHIEGSHFVHLNCPEKVAPHINTFFKKYGRFTNARGKL